MQNGPSIRHILEPINIKSKVVFPPDGNDANLPLKSGPKLPNIPIQTITADSVPFPVAVREHRTSRDHSTFLTATEEQTHEHDECFQQGEHYNPSNSGIYPTHSDRTHENSQKLSERSEHKHSDDAHDVDLVEEEHEHKGKLKWKEGKYKLGKKQYVANKYVYIPAKLMLEKSFNFAEIFTTVLDLKFVPSIIFRINRAVKTSEWNVKLPASRKYLHDKNKEALKEIKRDNMRDKLVDYSDMVEVNTGSSYKKYIPGTIEHYYKVLEENCRRLLRAQFIATNQAQAIYQVHEVWSDEFETDVVAEWVQESSPRGPYRLPVILGVADRSDFHDNIWAQLRDNCYTDYPQLEKDNRVPDPVILDPRPFYNGDIKVEYDERTGHPTKSIPHPALTHLIISENRLLLEQKIMEVAPWGMILINGGIKSAEYAVQAVQLSLPLVLYKFTGGTADIVVEVLEKVEKWIAAKRGLELNVQDIPPRPFPDDMCPGFQQPNWLYSFDETYVTSCNMLNVLVENWPDRHNKESIFIIDMFTTTEDDVQDRLTQVIAVAAGGEYELGGSAAEERRLSYAMRIRHKFSYNASYFNMMSDFLAIFQIFFAMISAMTAVFYGFYGSGQLGMAAKVPVLNQLSRINLILPLIATIVRGVVTATNPQMKYIALKNASVQVEGEVYMFRCKVGKYSTFKKSEDDEEEGGKDGKKGKKGKKKKKKKKPEPKDGDEDGNEKGVDDNGPNPRKQFQASMESIWKQLAGSDISNGSLMVPRSTTPAAALADINNRILSNRAAQDSYMVPMIFGPSKKKRDDDEDEAGNGTEENSSQTLLSSLTDCCAKLTCLKTPAGATPLSEVLLDDGISMMTPADYVAIRLNPMSAYYSAKSPSLHVMFSVISVVSNILSITATILAANVQTTLIPVVNAISEAVNAYSAYKQIELRLLQTNLALNQLNQLLVKWDSLTVIEKRVPSNVEDIVKRTEAVIRAQATIFQGGGGGGGEGDGEGGKDD